MVNIDRIFYLSLLSDFIISKLPKNNKSIIKLVDIGNFVIIKGKVSSTDVLDIHKIKNEFEEKYQNIFGSMKVNTIDIIEYESHSSDIQINLVQKFKI